MHIKNIKGGYDMLISNLDNVIKMNLQLLAGEGEEGNEQNPDDGGSEGGGEDPKTYTQEELDALLNDAKKDLPSEEDLAKFKEWQENQKTDEQKKNEKLEAEAKARKEAEEKVSTLEAKVSCLSKGVVTDSVDDVITLAKGMVTDTLTIDKAIDKVLEKYPSFKANGTETPGFKIGGSGDNGNQQTNINDALAMAFGNKK
ncbi:MAG: minor structural protein [Bacteriophage sp.]|nr:MAG: minor structural protein [Bacteriophage sp.]